MKTGNKNYMHHRKALNIIYFFALCETTHSVVFDIFISFLENKMRHCYLNWYFSADDSWAKTVQNSAMNAMCREVDNLCIIRNGLPKKKRLFFWILSKLPWSFFILNLTLIFDIMQFLNNFFQLLSACWWSSDDCCQRCYWKCH